LIRERQRKEEETNSAMMQSDLNQAYAMVLEKQIAEQKNHEEMVETKLRVLMEKRNRLRAGLVQRERKIKRKQDMARGREAEGLWMAGTQKRKMKGNSPSTRLRLETKDLEEIERVSLQLPPLKLMRGGKRLIISSNGSYSQSSARSSRRGKG
jgi:hypothetical protein